MKRYLITDFRHYATTDEALARIAHWAERGIDFIQVREKHLPARELAALVDRVLSVRKEASVVVNGRVDVALACGAQGAHLPSDAPPPSAWRNLAPERFLIGVSCHTLDEVQRAQAEGADYVLFAPVFEPLSKVRTGPAAGLQRLAEACAAVHIPVLALGGVTEDNAPLCFAAGAAGVAGITLYR